MLNTLIVCLQARIETHNANMRAYMIDNDAYTHAYCVYIPNEKSYAFELAVWPDGDRNCTHVSTTTLNPIESKLYIYI